jgi:hypothetical protein
VTLDRICRLSLSLSVRDFCFFFFSLSPPQFQNFHKIKRNKKKSIDKNCRFRTGVLERLSRGGLTVFPVLICLEGNVGESNQNKKFKIKQKLTRRLESNEK